MCVVQNLVDLCAQEARQCEVLKAHQAQLKGMGRQLQEALQLENDTAAHVRHRDSALPSTVSWWSLMSGLTRRLLRFLCPPRW